MENQLAKQAPTGVKGISQFFNSDAVKGKFTEILGKKGVGFISSVLTVVNSSKALKDADQTSIYTAAMIAASLDLPINPNLGFAYIVPYNESFKDERGNWQKRQVAQFQMGYKGFIQLAQRSGQYALINSSDVREGELINFNRMTGEMDFEFIQNTTERLSKAVVGFVSYFKLNNGFEHTLYMTAEEMLAHGKEYSQTFKSSGKGLWKDKFDAMALKTVTKLNLSKNGPLSIELQRAIVSDQGVIKSDAFLSEPEILDVQVEYIDNQEETKEEKVDSAKLIMRINKAKTLPELEKLKKDIAPDDNETYVVYDDKKHELAAAQKSENKLNLP